MGESVCKHGGPSFNLHHSDERQVSLLPQYQLLCSKLSLTR